jgi:hypothetical protein
MRPRTFAHALLNTFTSVQYYGNVLRAPLWFSVRFFLIALLCLGITRAAHVQTTLVPVWRQQSTAIIEQVEREFPAEVEISWNGRVLQTRDEQTIAVPYPDALQPLPDVWPPVLAYIIPQPLTADEVGATVPQRSFLVVSQDNLYVSDSRGSWSEMPLNALLSFDQPFTLSRETLPEHLETAHQWNETFWQWAQWGLAAFSLFYVVIVGTWLAVIEAVFAYFVLRLAGFGITYLKALQISLHLVVVAETVSQGVIWLYGPSELPIFSLTFWLLFAYIVWNLRSQFSASKGP